MSKKDIFICRFILLKPRSVEAATSPQVALFVLCSVVWAVAGDPSCRLYHQSGACHFPGCASCRRQPQSVGTLEQPEQRGFPFTSSNCLYASQSSQSSLKTVNGWIFWGEKKMFSLLKSARVSCSNLGQQQSGGCSNLDWNCGHICPRGALHLKPTRSPKELLISHTTLNPGKGSVACAFFRLSADWRRTSSSLGDSEGAGSFERAQIAWILYVCCACLYLQGTSFSVLRN